MPTIDVMMARSLRGGVWGSIARAIQPTLGARSVVSDAQSDFSNFKTAFSSWDNCMAVSYCKWPVIAVIIIVGLIILSVIYCISRCLCCGLSCCCECCRCLKCCGECCGCCDSPRKQKYLDEPYIPPHQGYRAEPAMSAGAIPPSRPAAKGADPPQYASFDTSKKEEGEDSLPAMPTWEDSESKKVVLEEEVVELQQLKKPETNGQGQPLMNGMSPSPSPGPNTPNGPGARSPYGPQGNQAAANGYMGPGPRGPGSRGPGGPPGAGAMQNPYGMQQGQGYNQMNNGYAQSQATFHTEQSWGVTGGQDYGQMPAPSPTGYDQHDYSPPPTNAPGYFDQGAYSEYGGTGNGPVPPVMNQPYGTGAEPAQAQQPQPQRRGPPRGALGAVGGAAMPDRSRGSPAPQQEPGYTGGQLDQPPLTYSPSPVQGGFSPAPERSFSPAPQRTFSPAPQQGFSPVPPQRAFSPAPPQRAFSPAPQRAFSPAPQQGFPSGPQRNFSPAPQRQYSADSAPGPGRGPMPPRGAPRGPPRGPPYRQFSADSAPNPQRQFSGDSAGRPLVGGLAGRPPPQRQFTADMARPPQSPGPQNNGGFDFQSGFSRPSRTNTFDSAGGDQPEQSGAYPGYKPYQPGR